MYISKLKIHGFKSFASKETLVFGEGITSIVGPNGCGKTNIVDAIRWVLGEQKYSVLRSAKMEDIIFNGAKGIKPLNVSEVYLTVHNDRGKLPVEYTDVEIGRRIFRNGESEFFINRTPCRLKDIHNLFIDTGMGSDAYSVIELKMIEQILSETSDDRKRMFEEAAGINKYKQQKRSALRKFEATVLDLERVDDIVHEVETKVHGLQLQLKRFKRHEKLTLQLKDQELVLASIKIQNLNTKADPLSRKIQDFHNQRQSKTTVEDQKENELKQLRELYRQSEKELNELQKNLRMFEEEREKYQHDLLRWNEQTKSAEANILRLSDEDKANIDKNKQQKRHIKDFNKEISSLEPLIEKKLEIFKNKRSELDLVTQKTQKVQNTVETLQSKRWELQQGLADHRSLMDRTDSLHIDKKELVEKFTLKIGDLEKENKGLSTEQTALEKDKKSLGSEIANVKTEIESINQKLEKEKDHLHDLSLQIQSVQNKVETSKSQRKFFEELIATSEGFPVGVQFALENKDRFKGLIGTIGDLFTVDTKYEKAIESSLGSWVSCLVTDSRNTAINILDEVDRNKNGNVSIVPLNETAALGIAKINAPNHPGLIGRASEMVKIEKNSNALINFLLGNVFIVESLDWDGKLAPGITLVDLKGAFIGSNFLMKNFSGSSEKSLIGRQKKIESLGKKLEKLKDEIVALENDQVATKSKVEQLMESFTEQNAGLSKLLDKQSAVDTNIIKNHYSQSKGLESTKELNEELATARNDVRQLSDSIKKLIPEGEEKDKELKSMIFSLAEMEQSLVDARSKQEESNRHLQEVRIELLNIENQKDGLVYQKRTADETLSELKSRSGKIKVEISSLKSQKNDLIKMIDEGNDSLKKVQAKLVSQQSIHELKRESFNGIFSQIEVLESSIRNEQKTKEALLDELKRCEIQMTEIDQQKKMVQQRIQELYDMDVPDNLDQEIMLQDESDLELSIDRIRRGLESIGPVNMAVQAECEDEEKRLKLLIDQKTDLLESEQNLRDSIQKIDRVARKQFKETFDKIKFNFEKLFTLFFEGGTATLDLSGDPDPLESDISISAQPPGKRNSSIRGLSAGEKALTAISLLFSIYQVKPSPYCILDEIDAPLDDTNVVKFTKVLKKFASETQFIIVTHNKLTMEAANFLYGVTMEHKGVSKLASVKFDGQEAII